MRSARRRPTGHDGAPAEVPQSGGYCFNDRRGPNAAAFIASEIHRLLGLGGDRPTGPSAQRSLLTDSSTLFVAQVTSGVGYLIASLLLARGLGQAGRGSIAFIAVTVVVVSTVARMGTAEAAVVFAARRPHNRAPLLTTVVLFTVISAAVAALLLCGILRLLGAAAPAGIGSTEIAVIGFGIVAAAIFDVSQLVLLGCGRIGLRATLTTAVAWVYALMLAFGAYRGGFSVSLAAAIWLAANTVGALLLLSISARITGVAWPDWRLFKEILSFGLRGWPGGLASFLNARIDQVLMGFIAPAAALGVYATAVNGAETLLYLPSAVSTALVPTIARGDPTQQTGKTLRVFRILLVLTGLSGTVATLAGPFLLPAVFGIAFHASIGPFLWLIPGAIGYAASRVFSAALFAMSRPGQASAGPIATLGTGLLLDLALIPSLGATGAAAAATGAFLAGGAVALFGYRHHYAFAWRELRPRSTDADSLQITRRLRSYWR
jgi:O-antigen/teichoic acid export membrane protein